MVPRAARVRLDGVAVGLLRERDGTIEFAYSPEWLNRPGAAPVSLTLPLRTEPYVTRGLHPFFENLLPEGWFLEVSSKSLKISRDDPFGLLLATCGDCAGAVEIEAIASDENL